MITLRLASPVVAVIAAAALVLVVATDDADADSIYTPTTGAVTCNAMDASFPDSDIAGSAGCSPNKQASAPVDVTLTQQLDSADLNTAQQIVFMDSDSAIHPSGAIPVGAKLGGSRVTESLSFSGGPCNTVFTTDFILYNVALPNNTGDPRASTNIAYPRNAGQADRFGAWQTGSPPVNGGPDNVTDGNGDTRADATTLSIQNYPSYLLDAFDPDFVPGVGDGPALPLVPKAVYGGLSLLLNEWQPLYLVQFNPGQLAALPGNYSLMATAMGHPLVFVQGDVTQMSEAPGAITDRCTPLMMTTMLRGRDPSLAHTRYTNPPAGTHFVVPYLASLRDTDQDGFENAIDSCPKQPNAGSPKTGAGDPDGDGLDDACDPSPAVLDPDPDGDIHVNRADKCPLDSNPGQLEGEAGVVPPDRGPRRDELGDPCDTGTISVTQNGRTFSLTLSPSVANGRYHTVTNNHPACYGPTPAGGTDADGDGYCVGNDGGGLDSPGNPSSSVRHTAWNNSYASALMQAIDTDGDGFTDPQELHISTDPTRACQQNPQYPTVSGGINDEAPLDNWPFDHNDDGRANTVDIGGYIPHHHNYLGGWERWDKNFDGINNSIDIGRFIPVLNKRCDAPPPAGMGFPTYNSQTQ